jgi:hypothetical protein
MSCLLCSLLWLFMVFLLRFLGFGVRRLGVCYEALLTTVILRKSYSNEGFDGHAGLIFGWFFLSFLLFWYEKHADYECYATYVRVEEEGKLLHHFFWHLTLIDWIRHGNLLKLDEYFLCMQNPFAFLFFQPRFLWFWASLFLIFFPRRVLLDFLLG